MTLTATDKTRILELEGAIAATEFRVIERDAEILRLREENETLYTACAWLAVMLVAAVGLLVVAA